MMKKSLVFTFLTLTLINGPVSANNLPDLGRSSAVVFSEIQEQQLGQAFIREIRRTRQIIDDPLINDYVQGIGNRLVAQSTAKKKRFNFFLVRDNTINAFAGPAGYIGINSGLILVTKNESELAGVMAHEIAHITQHHLARRIENAQQQKYTDIAKILAAVAVGAVTSGQVAAAGLAAAQGSSIQQSLDYSRSHEQEADRIGMNILYATNFDPSGMAGFFASMQKLSFNYSDKTPEFFRTHPLTQSRIADAKNRAEQYSPRSYSNSLNYYLMRERLRVITTPAGYQAVALMNHQVKVTHGNENIAAQYGYALALLKNHQAQLAQQQIQSLVQRYPQQIVFSMGLADTEMANQQSSAAVALLKQLNQQKPNYYPVQMEYATSLLQTGNFAAAKQIIKRLIKSRPSDPTIYEMLAQANGRNGNLADAYQARAKYYALNGNLEKALLQLEQARKLPRLNETTTLVLDAKITDLRKQIAKLKSSQKKWQS